MRRSKRLNGFHTANTAKTPFQEFLLAEHDHIAQAHFNTVDSIVRFFQYYLLIASVGPSLFVWLFSKVGDPAKNPSSVLVLLRNPITIAVVLTFLSVLGLLIMAYMVSLRSDAILYARTVNGIRKHFFDISDLELRDELQIRVLPRSPHFPRYREKYHFDMVVIALTLIDTFYAAVGWWLYLHSMFHTTYCSWIVPLAVAAVTAGLHVCAYYCISSFREFGYLRGHIIGTDIDGVLGMHREQFCSVYDTLYGKRIDPERITRIPVHECRNLGVTEAEEQRIFHMPNYWSEMPVCENAAYVLQRLRDIYSYKVHIFSWRPWPNFSSVSSSSEIRCRVDWGMSDIKAMTTAWLREHNIPFDKLVIERGNVDSPDPVGKTRNRYTHSQKYGIRIFVEDDLAKAQKLSQICDIVFLVKHPYNRTSGYALPKNIVEVDGWLDVYRFIKENL